MSCATVVSMPVRNSSAKLRLDASPQQEEQGRNATVLKPVTSKQLSTKLTVALVVVTVGFVVVAVVVCTNFIAGFGEFEEQANSTLGMTAAEAIAVMGDPSRTFGGSEYLSDHQAGIAKRYAPDPPVIEVDIVLRFYYVNSMALLFIKDGVVVDVYYGET